MKKLYFLIIALFISSLSFGQVLAEDFDYGNSNGDLTAISSGVWTGHSGTTPAAYIAAPTSLSMTDYPSSGVGGHVSLVGSNSQDVNRAFTEITSGTVYGSALVNLSSVGTGNYFMHFNSSGFRARVGAKDDGNGDVLFGIGTSSGPTYGTTAFSLNTTYLLVFSYEITSGVTNLYVLSAVTQTEPGSPEATSTGSTGTAINAISLRQSSNIPAVLVDGVRVATTWNEIMNDSSCNISFGIESYTCSTNQVGTNNDGVTINIPYTGLDVNLSGPPTTTSGGTVGGDDPSFTTNGTITISGLSEGDAWDILLSGGDCDGLSTSGTVPANECDPTPSTCYDLSAGPEIFELVTVQQNSGFSNNGVWENNSGTYSANGFCGGGCAEFVESWLIFGPLDMTGVSDLSLLFDAAENFGNTDLLVQYTNAYSGCPDSSSWTLAATITELDEGAVSVDLSGATGTDVFVGIQYSDDGTDGYSDWDLSNVELASFGSCPTLGTPPTSNCAVCDLVLGEATYTCSTNTAGDGNDMVTINIPYTGVEGTLTGLPTTTSGGAVGGDDPSVVTDGTITITGLMEGDAWDLTLNGGDCDGTTTSGTVASAQCDPVTMDLVINEIHADPASDITGDANGDGTRDGADDEFVELYNIGAGSLDISGYTIEDGFGLRHTFPASTILPSNSFITVFGGGTPTGIPGLTQVSSEGGLGLNNGGDDVIVKNGSGVVVVSYTYTGATDQSVARSPDYTGTFVAHSTITGNGGALFSPNNENDTVLSTNDFSNVNFSIYPNPTNTGNVTITSTIIDAMTVQVFDVLGKQVIIQRVTNNNLDVSNLRSGLYIVKITQNNASVTKKLVIK